MPRGIKQEPSATAPVEAPASKGDPAGAKGPKGAKSKATASLGVNKPLLKKKEGTKDSQKATGSSGDAGINLAELEERRKDLAEQLRRCELQIHRLETQYFETANPLGNALRGYDGLLSSTSASTSTKKAQFRPEDRIFSGSSTTGTTGLAGG